VAITFGITSPNNTSKNVTLITFIKKVSQYIFDKSGERVSIKKLVSRMMEIFTILLAISMEASNVFGLLSK
jgi:hypothetical protein